MFFFMKLEQNVLMTKKKKKKLESISKSADRELVIWAPGLHELITDIVLPVYYVLGRTYKVRREIRTGK